MQVSVSRGACPGSSHPSWARQEAESKATRLLRAVFGTSGLVHSWVPPVSLACTGTALGCLQAGPVAPRALPVSIGLTGMFPTCGGPWGCDPIHEAPGRRWGWYEVAASGTAWCPALSPPVLSLAERSVSTRLLACLSLHARKQLRSSEGIWIPVFTVYQNSEVRNTYSVI